MTLDVSQKTNILAETLQKNGVACSSTEALEKANQIIGITEGKVPEENKYRILEQKYRDLLEQNNNIFIKEINDVRNSMNSLISEINMIKRQLVQQQESIKNQESINSQRIEQPVNQQVQEKVEEPKENKKVLHSKQGSLTSEDVSIEKFFYFGKKDN